LGGIDTITSESGFYQLAKVWEKLASETSCSFFQSWTWNWYWWRSYKWLKSPFILVKQVQKEPTLIAPFFITKNYLALPIKLVSFIGTGQADYGNILFNPSVSHCVEDLFTFLAKSTSWDVIDLHQVNEDSHLYQWLRKQVSDLPFKVTFLPQDRVYKCFLPASWSEYLTSLSKKFRFNINYYRRRLERDYEVDLIEASQYSDIKQAINRFFLLHSRRLLSKKKPGLFLSPWFKKFHFNLIRALSSSEKLALIFLKVEGREVATLYGFREGKTFFYYLGGFDPKWGRLSVATVLLAETIKRCIDEKLEVFDFLRGDEPYKQRWQARPSTNWRILIVRENARSKIVQYLLERENSLIKRAKASLSSGS
jgi:CelD/BcsL family acetyltransferase involved in cellulose biosynthesis